MGLMQALSLLLTLLTELPERTVHINNVAAKSNFQTLCERWSLSFS